MIRIPDTATVVRLARVMEVKGYLFRILVEVITEHDDLFVVVMRDLLIWVVDNLECS